MHNNSPLTIHSFPPGFKVGHWTKLDAATGCTVVLCPDGAVAGADVRGGAPGTREMALLNPICTVERIHAVLLSGGSAFGLAAADGVMRWLEERGHGYPTGIAPVPIVPAAILFDLGIGRSDIRPDGAAGYAACQAATDDPISEGNVGAGTGATVGKLLGPAHATKGGIGIASRRLDNGVMVSALVAVNAWGNIYDPQTGQAIAGARAEGGGFAEPDAWIASGAGYSSTAMANTTLAVIATNASLSKAGATKVAQMAHDGLARVIRPVHTAFDGDTIFALSLGTQRGNVSVIGTVAADVVAYAVVRAVNAATILCGIPSLHDR